LKGGRALSSYNLADKKDDGGCERKRKMKIKKEIRILRELGVPDYEIQNLIRTKLKQAADIRRS